jgi:hypothetical protein
MKLIFTFLYLVLFLIGGNAQEKSYFPNNKDLVFSKANGPLKEVKPPT